MLRVMDNSGATGSMDGCILIGGAVYMEIGRQRVAGCSECCLIGIVSIGMDFHVGMDEGKEQGKLSVAGVDDRHCGTRRVGAVCPLAEVIVLTEQTACFAFHGDALVSVFAYDVVMVVMGCVTRGGRRWSAAQGLTYQ